MLLRRRIQTPSVVTVLSVAKAEGGSTSEPPLPPASLARLAAALRPAEPASGAAGAADRTRLSASVSVTLSAPAAYGQRRPRRARSAVRGEDWPARRLPIARPPDAAALTRLSAAVQNTVRSGRAHAAAPETTEGPPRCT